ncbi:glycosyltransferase [Nocardia brasiliensis]
MSTACVVPFHRVTRHEVQTLIRQIPTIDRIVFVINDEGSESADFSMLDEHPTAARIDLGSPVGKAEAVRIGLRKLIAEGAGYDLYLQLDAHDKQPARQIHRLAEAVEQGCADIAIASRYDHTNPSGLEHRPSLILLFNSLVKVQTCYTVTDSVCGMRAYSADVAEAFAVETTSYGYGLELEQLFVAAKHGWRVAEICVSSAPQYESTAVEKLVENLVVATAYVSRTEPAREIHRMIFYLKARRNFTVPGVWLNVPGSFRFTFIGPVEDDEDSYHVSYQRAHET